MRDEVYRMWVRFSYVWIPLSMIAIFFAPAYSGDWMYPIDKNSIAFLASVLFIVISLAIIAWKYIAIRKIR
ncbi:hypothetical protein FJY93_01640 [Candidatus Kaiserbacteria bacterium]|nr:hypothetical protein [Candidatus Kaiserbacteria bacterium]